MEYKEAFELTKKQRAALNALINEEDCESIRKVLRKKRKKSRGLEDPRGELDVPAPFFEDARIGAIDSPLQYAYKNKKLNALQTLLDCGLDPAEKLYYDSESLLEILIRDNELELLGRVLPFADKCTGQLRFQLEGGVMEGTFLGYCAALGRVEAANMLLEDGHRMVPLTTREALELDQDCVPVYSGKYYGRKDENDHSCFLGTPLVNSIEPWQFALLGEDTEAADFFLDFGKNTNSRSLREMILRLEDEAMIRKAEQRFPEAVAMMCSQKYADRILEAGNAWFLKRSQAEDWDVTRLCAEHEKNDQECWADRAVKCYGILKQRLKRPLTSKEKYRLSELMLKLKSEQMVEICEGEWGEEFCDVTGLSCHLPTGFADEKALIRRLEQSSLRLTIRADDPVFERGDHEVGRNYYRDNTPFLRNYRTVAVLDKIATVVPPEEMEDRLIPFTKAVLNTGKKSTFKRLQKWGLLHAKNMNAAVEFMAENGLSEYYDQAVQSGSGKKNQKTYEL